MLNLLNLKVGEVIVDVKIYEICRKINQKNPTAAACKRILMEHILNTGPVFYKNESSMTISPYFKEIVSNYWVPFCHDVVESILCLGIVPVFVAKLPNERGGIHVPCVYKGVFGKDFLITIKTKGRPEFIFYKKKDMVEWKKSKKVKIWSGFGTDPNADGTLTSVVSTIIEQVYWMDKLMKYSLTAEYNRSDPTLVTQLSQETIGTPDEDLKFGHYKDIDPSVYREQSRYKRSQEVFHKSNV